MPMSSWLAPVICATLKGDGNGPQKGRQLFNLKQIIEQAPCIITLAM